MAAIPTTTTRPALRLQPGETVLLEGGPSPRQTTSLALGTGLVCLLSVVGAPFALLAPLIARQAMAQHRWWLTDRRLVVRTGFIGWTVRSVPLARVVDVTTTASWWDLLFGVQHIVVRDMTGEVGGNHVASGLKLMGLEDVGPVADAVLDAITPAPDARAA